MADIKDYEDQIKEIAKDKKWSDERLKKELAKLQRMPEDKRDGYIEKLKKEDSDKENQNGDKQKDKNKSAAADNGNQGENKPNDNNQVVIDEPVAEGEENKKEVNVSENSDDKPQPNAENTNQDWKALRREEWKKFAEKKGKEFAETTEAQAPDLGLKVGADNIHYQDSSNVNMSNGEYDQFLTLVQIEKKDKTEVINFGDIKSDDYKAKLAAACVQEDMKFKNGPRYIDLNLECFKNLDDATKAKINDFNEKNKIEDKYKAKVEELKKLKEGKGALDFAQIKDPTERLIAYTAAKETGVKINNLANDELIYDEQKNPEKKQEIERVRKVIDSVRDKTAVKEDAFDMHERRVKSLQKMHQEVKDGTRHRGEFTKDGKKQEASLRQTINGTTYHVDRKDVKTEVVDGKEKYVKNNLGKDVLTERNNSR